MAVYTPPFKPRARQAEALAKSAGKKAFAYLMAMRCVDADTEYLSPEGWRRIADYKSGTVAEFRLDGTAHFVEPKEFIKAPVDKFYRFKSNGGVDQVLSANHRILACSPARHSFSKRLCPVPEGFRTHPRKSTDWWREFTPQQMIDNKRGMKEHVPVTFMLQSESRIALSEIEIRIQVAFHADGSYGTRDLSRITGKRKGVISVKKEAKKERLRELLRSSGIVWKERLRVDGYSLFVFVPPLVSKTFGPEWWNASFEQRRIIADEAWRWDGRKIKSRGDAKRYSSMHESDADFIQFCYSSTGERASKTAAADGTFIVHVTGSGRSGNLALLPKPEPYDDHDGFMYSFSVPSTFLVLRRNGKIFVTGNTGKTKVTLDDYGRLELAGEVDDLLIVAPGGVYKTWEGAALEHFSLDLRKRIAIFVWESGMGKRAQKALKEFLALRDRPRMFIINIEALSAVKAAREAAIEFAKARKTYVAVDESTTIKNPSSKRTKFVIRELGWIAEFRRILSGLPTPKNPLDIFAQFEFLDWRILGFKNFIAFRARYAIIQRAVFGGRDVPLIKGFRNLDEIHAKISEHSYRATLEDCYDLPPKLYSFREIEMTDEQARIYNEMKKFATAKLSETEHVTATIVIAQIARLHQILCGHTVDEDGKLHEIPENRTRSLIEMLQEYDGKAIIWCSYDQDVQKVTRALEKEFGEGSAARFWGGNRSTREAEEKRFQDDHDCRWMVATASAGGRGRMWAVANLVVYYSSTSDLEHRAQSEERPQAVGKMNSVAYVDMIVRGTVEERIIKSLRGKIDMASVITGDNYKEWLI